MELRKTRTRLTKEDRALLEKARTILLKDLLYGYTIPQLAQKVGTNEKKLKVGFRELFGSTIHDFVMENRMAKAKQLLAERELSIAEIASRTGYNSISYFSQAFKRTFNQPPSQWIYTIGEN